MEMPMRSAMPVVMLALALGACEQEQPQPAQEAATRAPAARPPADTPADQAQTNLDSPEPDSPPTDDEGFMKVGAVAIAPPPAWTPETPANSMRKAQFVIPGEGGDASLVVYHFPGAGGDVLANIDRWCDQFAQEDGRRSQELVEISEDEISGMPVTTAWLTGRYVAETTPGSGVRLDEPGWALHAAIVETPEGPYFFKAVGPESTLAPNRTAFDAMIARLRPAL
jgi:hypothetical protein